MRLTPLLVVAALSVCTSCTEIHQVHVASYNEAKAAGLAERGWLPVCIAPIARDISEAHDLDTNEQWIRYVAEFTPSPRWAALDGSALGQLRLRPPRGVRWWPDELRSVNAVLESGWNVFSVPDANRRCFLALQAGVNYCWCESN